MNKILILKNDRVGDLFNSLDGINAILEDNPNAKIDKQKLFQVAYNINPQDKRYEELSKKYHTMDNVTNWEKRKFENIKVDTVLFKFNNSSKNELEGL